MSIDSPHALRVEIARLQRELNAAQAAVVREKVRADAANSKLAATDVERLQALSALSAARRECEGLRKALWQIANARLPMPPRASLTTAHYQMADIARAALAAPAPAPGEET